MDTAVPHEGGLTFDDVKRLYAEPKPEPTATIDDYADYLRHGIDCSRAELRRIRAKRSTMIGRFVRLIRWASTPKTNKPHRIPGVGLEAALIGLHVMIGVGHIVLILRG